MAESFEGWAIIELMGHRRLAGYVSDVEIVGARMLRVDIPAGGDVATEAPSETTQFCSPAALYCLTPTTEELARQVAGWSRPAPVRRFELAPITRGEGVEDAEFEDGPF